VKNGYEPDPETGVDILDLFMQSETDPWKLGGMVFSFLSAGRKLHPQYTRTHADDPGPQATRLHSVSHGS
jgi:hypothetical protein